MPNPDDITDSTTAMNMALALMAKAFKLNYSTPTNNNQRISLNPRNRQIAQLGCSESKSLECWKSEWDNWCSKEWKSESDWEWTFCLRLHKEYDLMAAAADLDEIKEVNANFILLTNLQQTSSSGTQTNSTPVYDSDGSAE
nr:hypothetical protein [Tanacetum cinerariifolium]